MTTRGKLFWTGTIGFVAGIVCASFLDKIFSESLVIVSFILTISAIIVKKRSAGIALFFVGAVGIGGYHYASFFENTAERVAVSEGIVRIGGEVDAVETREKGYRALVSIDVVEDSEVKSDVRAYVYYETKTDLLPGDTAVFEGELALPEPFDTDQGRSFDYEAYLRARNIGHVMYGAQFISKEKGNISWKRLVHISRASLLGIFDDALSPREAALVSGITLGARSSIDTAFNDALIATGTIHIVALSGYNVTIVSGTVFALLARVFRKRRALFFAMISIVLFVMLAGGGSPAVRAGIMAVLALLAKYLGSSYSIDRAVALAFLIMLLFNPLLLFDISFQLSFLATVGVVYASAGVERRLAWVPSWTMIREPLALTLSAQLFVLPILIHQAGVLSFTSVPANIIVGPLVPLVMAFGFFAMILSVFGSIFALPMVLLSGFTAGLIIWIVFLFAGIPFGAVTIPKMHGGVTVAAYTFISWRVFGSRLKGFFWLGAKEKTLV